MKYLREEFSHLPEVVRKRIPATPADHMRLHRLERPVSWQQDLLWHMFSVAGTIVSEIQQYPDYSEFHSKAAKFLGVREHHLVMGLGAEDLLRSLLMLTCSPWDTFLYPYPTCAMFELYSTIFKLNGARLIWETKHSGIKPLASSYELLVSFIRNCKPKLVLHVNPGQPIEVCLSPTHMAGVARACQDVGALLVIDEAYYGFGAPTALRLIEDFDNVVILRSFSKAMGAAGLRIGFAITNGHLAKAFNGLRLSGELAGPSMVLASVLMDNFEEFVKPGIIEVILGRNWLRREIQKVRGVTGAWGTLSNHVLVELVSPLLADHVFLKLEAAGAHVKQFGQRLLITCGPLPIMDQLLVKFSTVMQENSK